jgi:hypothetical protein
MYKFQKFVLICLWFVPSALLVSKSISHARASDDTPAIDRGRSTGYCPPGTTLVRTSTDGKAKACLPNGGDGLADQVSAAGSVISRSIDLLCAVN